MTTTDEQDAAAKRVEAAAKELASAISAAHDLRLFGRVTMRADAHEMESGREAVQIKTDVRVGAHIIGNGFDWRVSL